MKLLRYGPPGQEKPGLLDAQGVLRDASHWTADWAGEALAPAALQALRQAHWQSWPQVPGQPRLGCPVGQVRKIVCVGLNYADHAREAGLALPDEPVLFMKAASALCGPHDDLTLPPHAHKVDWEVELGLVIGQRMQHVPEWRAMEYLAGYVLANDISERAWQMERGGQWDKGKSHDGFAPVGPWLVTCDEVEDPHNLALWLELNGAVMQDGHTSQFIFQVPRVLAYISEFMTLEPGDIVLTGTPAGVGLGQRPQPRFVRDGDVMQLGCQGLGEQRILCRAWAPEPHAVQTPTAAATAAEAVAYGARESAAEKPGAR